MNNPLESKHLPFGQSTEQCGFRADGKTEKTRCQNPAVYRSPIVARCREHGGHHDYTERWIGTEWVPHSSIERTE